MTQTIRTPNGPNAVWIEAAHGGAKPRRVEWYKITLAEYLESLDLEHLDDEQAEEVKGNLEKFDKGYAYRVCDESEEVICRTWREAREWAYRQFC